MNPDIEEDYFCADDLTRIQSASSHVKAALENWNVDFTGLDEREKTQSLPEGSYRVAEPPIYVRCLSFDAHPAGINLEFNTAWTDERLNAAWERLWDALGTTFAEESRMTRVKVNYSALGLTRTLKQYAQLLASLESS